ncbi:MAG: tetratricopeptide repeat protein, partial [Thiogranum sp.]
MNMKPFLSRAPLVARLTLLVFLVCFPPVPSLAGSLRPSTYQQLTSVHERIDRQAYNEALEILDVLLAEAGDHSYEKAVVLQTLGYVQISREAYPAAIQAFEQSLALEQLPGETQQRVRFNLAQLCLSTGKTTRAIRLLEDWFSRVKQADADAYALLGYAYAQDRQYIKAIDALQHAIKLSDDPRADWYEALLAVHYERQSYRACIPLLKDMIRRFPERRRYWQQLAGIHLALDDHDAAIAALELALRDGALTREKELLQLAQLYLYSGIPYKAARLLEKEMKTGRVSDVAEHRKLLARAWNATGERDQAIHALERAIDADPAPELRLQLAQWYFDEERWQAAEDILQSVTDYQDNTRIRAQGWLLLGIARFEQGNTAAAHEAFDKASRLPEARDTAIQWLQFIETLVKE